MNNLIYYPSFEIRNQDWLKFAILYLKNLNMIIPDTGDRYLSREFNEIYESIDLFRLYRPNRDEGYSASLDAIGVIEPLLRNPEYYAQRFKISNGNETIIDKWRNQQNQTFEVFREKYSGEFVDFCLRNGLGHESPNGLMLPKELSNIFMGLLAKSIGDSNRFSPITDIPKYDYFTNIIESPQNEDDGITLAQNVINVFLPRNLNQIPIESLLQLRTSDNYDQKLTAFQNAVNQFHSHIEDGDLTRQFIETYENPFRDLVQEIKELTLDLAGYGLGTWMILSAPNIEIPHFIKDVAIGGLTIYTGRKIKLKRTWQHTHNRILTRRYLTGIKRISFIRNA